MGRGEVEHLLLVICSVSLCDSWSRHIINVIITLTPTKENVETLLKKILDANCRVYKLRMENILRIRVRQ
jgi:hypothetical protein